MKKIRSFLLELFVLDFCRIFYIPTDVDGVNHFPEDFEDLPMRNDSARARRRDRYPSPRVCILEFLRREREKKKAQGISNEKKQERNIFIWLVLFFWFNRCIDQKDDNISDAGSCVWNGDFCFAVLSTFGNGKISAFSSWHK